MESETGLIELFKKRRSECLPTVLVFYRSADSFFCRMWITRWLSTVSLARRLAITNAAILFVSSQSQGKAYALAEQCNVPSSLLDSSIFFFGDPEHTLVNLLKEIGYTTPVITTGRDKPYKAHGWCYDFGMVQPAIIAFAGEEHILTWIQKPSIFNGGGKLKRNDPWEVWDYVERMIDRIRMKKVKKARS